MRSKFCFAIDRGGTFTDVYAKCPNGKEKVLKLLSEDPIHYKDAPTEGIRRILEQELGSAYSGPGPLKTECIEWIRMGTTVATNALLERKGERIALAITKGFKDLLFIGNQTRPNIFDLEVVCPSVLYEEVIEIDERVVPKLVGEDEGGVDRFREVVGTTGESLLVRKEVNPEEVERDLRRVREKGIKSLAVLLLHSFKYPAHECLVESLAHRAGFEHVSVSSRVMPMVKAVPRGFTACTDAYLTPHIKTYIQGFRSGFENELEGVNVLFMQSDGGLTPTSRFNGSRAILSGPAGGVVGYAKTAFDALGGLPVIGFDMGGTSTDVSRYAGEFEHVFETTTAGVTIQSPQLDINTVAAGGGSRLFFRSGMFVVGPESAGAHPGPACYKKGGPLAVTDANLVLGRLLPQYFPRIFGAKENEALDKPRSVAEFEKLRGEILCSGSGVGHKSVEEVALGFVRVANEAMCRPIRALTQAKGHDTRGHVLAVFGGAGGQHACAIARSLGMGTVFVHRYAGILSAFGIALADVVHEAQEPCAQVLAKENQSTLQTRLLALESECLSSLQHQGFPLEHIEAQLFLNLRYQGTDFALMCSVPRWHVEGGMEEVGGVDQCIEEFNKRYETEFGFRIPDRPILVDDIRVRGVGKSEVQTEAPVEPAGGEPVHDDVTQVYFESGYAETKVYVLHHLRAGHSIRGPAIIIDQLSTILIEPGCVSRVTSKGDVIIEIGREERKIERGDRIERDAVQLSIFAHRFMSLAEQMGRILQRTSISTNIKERLDFSCALFGPDGGLVSNAPHIPVHLGAMQETVQHQLKAFGDTLTEGDVLLSNHPSAGGSHLPDLTVITPVFRRGTTTPVFYVASRGHHADIGGTTPGSMPPHSTSILEEGAVFMEFKVVEGGVFQEEQVVAHLLAPGKVPGSSGSRNVKDNLSDLKAQVAANHRGIQLVNELIELYSLPTVQAYMSFIQESAEEAVRCLLKKVGQEVKGRAGGQGEPALQAEETMDDGSVIKLTVKIDDVKGTAVFDFTGTGPEVWGNCNAPRAITVSALIYSLRCLVQHDIPLNQGCLKPVTLIVPPGCLLNPSPEAAVVGGNVLTSQRVVDVILKAFGACAASQGCMNNVTFGNESFGYYETVAGGAGAGPSWPGRSGVHTHMTNTRITDPEILEHRYPVILNAFTLNPNTGGRGMYCGGDGVVRELLFRSEMTLSILTERRVIAPYGLHGGESGARGQNLLIRKGGKVIRLPSKSSVAVGQGDIFRLESPGGGGFGVAGSGSPQGNSLPKEKKKAPPVDRLRGSVYDYCKSQESA